jgi:hypothetical protein
MSATQFFSMRDDVVNCMTRIFATRCRTSSATLSCFGEVFVFFKRRRVSLVPRDIYAATIERGHISV